MALRPLGWTEAEHGDPSRYAGDEVICFARNAGPYRAGEQVEAADVQAQRWRHSRIGRRLSGRVAALASVSTDGLADKEALKKNKSPV